MPFTTGEIAKKVLQKIGRLPDGQVAPASQVKTVTDAYAMLYEELLNNSLVNWTSEDDVPDFASRSIIILLAGRVSDNFGVPNQWLQLEPLMMNLLSQQLTSPYVPGVTTFESF